jgi:hypothetical protein
MSEETIEYRLGDIEQNDAFSFVLGFEFEFEGVL